MKATAIIRWLRKHWLQLSLGVGIVFVLLAIQQSPSVQKCLSEYSSQNQKYAEEEQQSAFSVFIHGNASCLNDFFARNTGAITAVTAIIVTILTIALTSAASTQSEAASDSVKLARRAFETIERPFVFASPKQTHSDWSDETYPKNIYVWLDFQNYGRSPAQLYYVKWTLTEVENTNPGDILLFAESTELTNTLGPGEFHSTPPKHFAVHDNLTKTKFSVGQSMLVACGYIVYYDIFDTEHRTGFGFRYHVGRGDLDRWGGLKYNYST